MRTDVRVTGARMKRTSSRRRLAMTVCCNAAQPESSHHTATHHYWTCIGTHRILNLTKTKTEMEKVERLQGRSLVSIAKGVWWARAQDGLRGSETSLSGSASAATGSQPRKPEGPYHAHAQHTRALYDSQSWAMLREGCDR